MKIYKIADIRGGIDINTLIVGKIKTIEQAKKICKGLFWKSLPKPGEEITIDSGIVKLNYKASPSFDKPFTYERNEENGLPRRYETYLQNSSGTFRVWTWISVI